MNSSPNVQVGILKAKRIEFRLAGKFEISGTSSNCYGSCIAEIKNGEILIKNEDRILNYTRKVIFVPCNISSDYFEMSNVVIGIDFHWEQSEVQRFRGALKLFQRGEDIQVINIIPVENYLISVISSEMSAESSPELLKAHAIISRSWLMAQLHTDREKKTNTRKDLNPSEEEYIYWYNKEDHQEFHVCADDHCQRYQGITKITNPRVIEAVNETYGRVLTFDGEICDTRYSKACGGKSERFESCWEPVEHPYLVPVTDYKDDSVDTG
ncbi:MAG: SpoIID/LytB domain-containing protein, partial [Bacteroidota bacterium]